MSEPVATEADAYTLVLRTVLRDANDDVFVKVSERGFDLAGYAGRLGPSWIRYPAEVLWEPSDDPQPSDSRTP